MFPDEWGETPVGPPAVVAGPPPVDGDWHPGPQPLPRGPPVAPARDDWQFPAEWREGAVAITPVAPAQPPPQVWSTARTRSVPRDPRPTPPLRGPSTPPRLDPLESPSRAPWMESIDALAVEGPTMVTPFVPRGPYRPRSPVAPVVPHPPRRWGEGSRVDSTFRDLYRAAKEAARSYMRIPQLTVEEWLREPETFIPVRTRPYLFPGAVQLRRAPPRPHARTVEDRTRVKDTLARLHELRRGEQTARVIDLAERIGTACSLWDRVASGELDPAALEDILRPAREGTAINYLSAIERYERWCRVAPYIQPAEGLAVIPKETKPWPVTIGGLHGYFKSLEADPTVGGSAMNNFIQALTHYGKLLGLEWASLVVDPLRNMAKDFALRRVVPRGEAQEWPIETVASFEAFLRDFRTQRMPGIPKGDAYIVGKYRGRAQTSTRGDDLLHTKVSEWKYCFWDEEDPEELRQRGLQPSDLRAIMGCCWQTKTTRRTFVIAQVSVAPVAWTMEGDADSTVLQGDPLWLQTWTDLWTTGDPDFEYLRQADHTGLLFPAANRNCPLWGLVADRRQELDHLAYCMHRYQLASRDLVITRPHGLKVVMIHAARRLAAAPRVAASYGVDPLDLKSLKPSVLRLQGGWKPHREHDMIQKYSRARGEEVLRAQELLGRAFAGGWHPGPVGGLFGTSAAKRVGPPAPLSPGGSPVKVAPQPARSSTDPPVPEDLWHPQPGGLADQPTVNPEAWVQGEYWQVPRPGGPYVKDPSIPPQSPRSSAPDSAASSGSEECSVYSASCTESGLSDGSELDSESDAERVIQEGLRYVAGPAAVAVSPGRIRPLPKPPVAVDPVSDTESVVASPMVPRKPPGPGPVSLILAGKRKRSEERRHARGREHRDQAVRRATQARLDRLQDDIQRVDELSPSPQRVVSRQSPIFHQHEDMVAAHQELMLSLQSPPRMTNWAEDGLGSPPRRPRHRNRDRAPPRPRRRSPSSSPAWESPRGGMYASPRRPRRR